MITLLPRRGNTLGPGIICLRCNREIHGLLVGVALAEANKPAEFIHSGACLAAARANGDNRQAFELAAFLQRLGVAAAKRSSEWKTRATTGVNT